MNRRIVNNVRWIQTLSFIFFIHMYTLMLCFSIHVHEISLVLMIYEEVMGSNWTHSSVYGDLKTALQMDRPDVFTKNVDTFKFFCVLT